MKNLKTFFFLLIIFITNAVFALGDKISPKQIEDFYSDSNTRLAVLSYFSGLGSGIAWSNTMIQEKMFCPPSDLSFVGEDYYSIYKAEYLREKKPTTIWTTNLQELFCLGGFNTIFLVIRRK